jgi:hypothetical protein
MIMDISLMSERVFSKIAGRGEDYRNYFEKKLKKWNVSSPSEIPKEKKVDFFKEVDDGWESEEEKGKEATLQSRRGSLKSADKNMLR